ncbi:ABC transporter ATP-binding protein [Plantactinospora alkalitolerans]|nr:ABC transporter ATP-binding protein [Plantactinospora alkalitolerans]
MATAAAMALATRAAPGSVAALVVASLGAGTAPVAIAWLTKLLIDRVAARTPGGLTPLLQLALLLGVVAILSAVIPHVTTFAAATMGRNVRVVVRDRLFTRVSRLPGLVRLEDPPFYDRLMLALQAGAESPGQVLGGVLGLTQAIITMTGFLITLTVLSPVMAAVVVVAAVPAFAAEILLNKRRVRLAWQLGPTERRELFYTELLRSLQTAKEIRLFNVADFLRTRMLTDLRSINSARQRMDRQVLTTQGALALLSAGIASGGLVWAAASALSGRLTVGDVSMFVAAVAGTQSSLTGLIRGLSVMHQAQLMFDHYRIVMRTPSDLPVSATPRPVPELSGGIELRGVWFRYGDDQPWVLRDTNLLIRAGQATALVGRNGSGKSTLVKLLCRLYDPTRGAILWDGVDIREFDPAQLRDRLSAVFQDYTCYDLTVAENIAMGDISALDDPPRLEAAAERAGVADVVDRLPRGYETLLSRMFQDVQDGDPASGVLLSGGQWQRVALARALLRDRHDLLILDEPSSGLDAEAEYEIHRRLKRYRAGRTSLLISHRLGTVRDAPTIAVLDGGRVTEQGRHEELLDRDGTYARLFTLQARGYSGEAEDEPAEVAARTDRPVTGSATLAESSRSVRAGSPPG